MWCSVDGDVTELAIQRGRRRTLVSEVGAYSICIVFFPFVVNILAAKFPVRVVQSRFDYDRGLAHSAGTVLEELYDLPNRSFG